VNSHLSFHVTMLEDAAAHFQQAADMKLPTSAIRRKVQSLIIGDSEAV
jgi:hypothetical protein